MADGADKIEHHGTGHRARLRKRLFEKQMETFAGFAEHTDHEVGRLVAQLEKIGALDNTLLFYIVGDNGASAEGGMIGMVNLPGFLLIVPLTVLLAPVGAWIGSKLDAVMLKRVFAVFLCISGGRMLMQVLGS